jgi:endonuclease III
VAKAAAVAAGRVAALGDRATAPDKAAKKAASQSSSKACAETMKALFERLEKAAARPGACLDDVDVGRLAGVLSRSGFYRDYCAALADLAVLNEPVCVGAYGGGNSSSAAPAPSRTAEWSRELGSNAVLDILTNNVRGVEAKIASVYLLFGAGGKALPVDVNFATVAWSLGWFGTDEEASKRFNPHHYLGNNGQQKATVGGAAAAAQHKELFESGVVTKLTRDELLQLHQLFQTISRLWCVADNSANPNVAYQPPNCGGCPVQGVCERARREGRPGAGVARGGADGAADEADDGDAEEGNNGRPLTRQQHTVDKFVGGGGDARMPCKKRGWRVTVGYAASVVFSDFGVVRRALPGDPSFIILFSAGGGEFGVLIERQDAELPLGTSHFVCAEAAVVDVFSARRGMTAAVLDGSVARNDRRVKPVFITAMADYNGFAQLTKAPRDAARLALGSDGVLMVRRAWRSAEQCRVLKFETIGRMDASTRAGQTVMRFADWEW